MKRFRIIVMATSFLFLGLIVEAQVPQILSYQGRVSVNGTNFDGTGQFQFAFVDGTGTVTYWSNGNSAVSLPVSGGLYSVLLGDTTVTNMAAIPATVFTNTDVLLRVWFNGGAGLQQLSPDRRFAAVGYALMAANVPNGAITSSQLAFGAVGTSQLATGAVTAVTIANGAVGTSQLANNAVTSANIASNTITAANMAPGAGVVPPGTIVLSQTPSNAALVAAGFAPMNNPGSSWIQLPQAAWSGRYLFGTVVFNGKMWVLGGYLFNDVWSSSDSTNWTEVTAAAPWSARSGLGSVVFNGQMWVLGGYIGGGGGALNDVWSSSDGANWTEVTAAAPWSARYAFGSVVFNGKMWVLGGFNGYFDLNDVWSSSDGTNWTEVTASAPWSARDDFGSVVFNGQMWVFGGRNYNGNNFNDVWSSSDGTNWTEVTASTPWSARYEFGSVVLDGQMLVLGGYAGVFPSFLNDVWSSSDGTNWTEVTAIAPWSQRFGLGTVVFNNQMWVLGGNNSNYGISDVWSSPVIPELGGYFLFQKQ